MRRQKLPAGCEHCKYYDGENCRWEPKKLKTAKDYWCGQFVFHPGYNHMTAQCVEPWHGKKVVRPKTTGEA